MKYTVIASIAALLSTTAASASGCDASYKSGTLAEHRPGYVAVDDLQEFMDENDIAGGITYSFEEKDDELWIDIEEVSSETSGVVVARNLFVFGRVLDKDYRKFILSDEGAGVFSISGPKLQSIGCQFVWKEDRGENPIVLLRALADNLTYHDSGSRVAPPFNGSLLGDTKAAMDTLSGNMVPQWVLSAPMK